MSKLEKEIRLRIEIACESIEFRRGEMEAYPENAALCERHKKHVADREYLIGVLDSILNLEATKQQRSELPAFEAIKLFFKIHMAKFGINVSPISNNVYVGRLDKKNTCFLEKDALDPQHAVSVAIEILRNSIPEGNEGIEFESESEVISFCISKKSANPAADADQE